MEQTNKLDKFRAAVFAEVDTKTDLIKHEAEEYRNSELEKNKDAQLLKSFNEIQKQSQDIKKRLKREVAKYSLDSKRKVLIRRNEITETSFDAIRKRLEDFYNGNDYNDYIIKKLQMFSAKYSLSDIEIHVGTKDFILGDMLKNAYALPCVLIEDASIKLGGFIAKDIKNNCYFDETIATILSDQKEYFIQNSGLFL